MASAIRVMCILLLLEVKENNASKFIRPSDPMKSQRIHPRQRGSESLAEGFVAKSKDSTPDVGDSGEPEFVPSDCIPENFDRTLPEFWISRFKAEYHASIDCCYALNRATFYYGEKEGEKPSNDWFLLPIPTSGYLGVWTGVSDQDTNNKYFHKDENNIPLLVKGLTRTKSGKVNIILAIIERKPNRQNPVVAYFSEDLEHVKGYKKQFICRKSTEKTGCDGKFEPIDGFPLLLKSSSRLKWRDAKTCCENEGHTLKKFVASYSNSLKLDGSYWIQNRCTLDQQIEECLNPVKGTKPGSAASTPLLSMAATTLGYPSTRQDPQQTQVSDWTCVNYIRIKNSKHFVPQRSSCNKALQFICERNPKKAYLATKPKSGEPCNPDLYCARVGYCQEYYFCKDVLSQTEHPEDEMEGKIQYHSCENPDDFHNLFYNLETGSCTWFDHLPEDVQKIYLADEECRANLKCLWEPTGECSGDYMYFNPEGANGKYKPQKLSCPTNDNETLNLLVWDQSRKNCFPCTEVLKLDQTTFCCEEFK